MNEDPAPQQEAMQEQAAPPEQQQMDAAPQQQEQQDGGQERTDWKAKYAEVQSENAYYRGFMEAQNRLQNQGGAPQQQQQLPESVQLEQQIQELQQNAPQGDPLESTEAYKQHQQHQQQLQDLRFRLARAENREMRQTLLEQQSHTVVERFKEKARSGPTSQVWQQVESEFDAAVQALAPQNRNNPQMLETIKRNLEYPLLMQGLNQQGQRSAPQTPSGAYNQQPSPPKPQQAQWKSEQDRRIGEGIYGMTPERYYNEADSPDANGNGIQIYSPSRRA